MNDVELETLLGERSRVPTDISRFTSETLFGQPGIYPDGPTMATASGPIPTEQQVVASLGAYLNGALAGESELIEQAWSHFHALADRVLDAAIRAALAALVGTAGELALDVFVSGSCEIDRLAFGVPDSPGRVIGPQVEGANTTRHVVNARYQSEHFALLTPSLAHYLLWSGPGAGHAEETTLHFLAALVHVQTLSRAPAIADLGTELARRPNSLAITLLNSRHPGESRISVVAPDGLGTIPGGSSSMQTPDFWSVPFGPAAADGESISDAVRKTLSALGLIEAPPS
ncbi:MAG: hypothetical protein EXQ69_09110 [Acidimicrobiia bacterium]|nr:hypothetical protein [Acidimicrobiia bacterium]